MYKSALALRDLLERLDMEPKRFSRPLGQQNVMTPTQIMQNYTMRWYEHEYKTYVYKEADHQRSMGFDEERVFDFIRQSHERCASEISRFRQFQDRGYLDETQERRLRKNLRF